MATGWITLHRKVQDNPLWKAEKFTRGQAWVDLILLANHEEGFIYVRGNKIEIQRGQVGWSQKRLAERWKWSRTKVRKFLEDLEEEHQIKQHKNNVSTIITLINYKKYQQEKQQTGQQTGQQKDSRNQGFNEQLPKNTQIGEQQKKQQKKALGAIETHKNKDFTESKNSKKNSKLDSRKTAERQQKDTNNNDNNVNNDNKNILLSDLAADDFDVSGTVDEKIDWTTIRFFERAKAGREHYKNIKKATLGDWREPIRLMHTEDGLPFNKIWGYLKFLFQDEFWKNTVYSTAGFRKNWEEIDSALKRNKDKASSDANTTPEHYIPEEEYTD